MDVETENVKVSMGGAYYGDNHTEHKYIFVGLGLVLVILGIYNMYDLHSSKKKFSKNKQDWSLWMVCMLVGLYFLNKGFRIVV